MAKSNNESIERILTKFLDEFHQGKNPKIRDYLRLYVVRKKSSLGNLQQLRLPTLPFIQKGIKKKMKNPYLIF